MKMFYEPTGWRAAVRGGLRGDWGPRMEVHLAVSSLAQADLGAFHPGLFPKVGVCGRSLGWPRNSVPPYKALGA